MAIWTLFELDFFTCFLDWSNFYLTIPMYICLVFGFVIQFMLFRKSKKIIWRWFLICLCGIGIIISEITWHILSGWDKLAAAIICGGIICILLGAILAVIITCVCWKKSPITSEHGSAQLE